MRGDKNGGCFGHPNFDATNDSCVKLLEVSRYIFFLDEVFELSTGFNLLYSTLDFLCRNLIKMVSPSARGSPSSPIWIPNDLPMCVNTQVQWWCLLRHLSQIQAGVSFVVVLTKALDDAVWRLFDIGWALLKKTTKKTNKKKNLWRAAWISQKAFRFSPLRQKRVPVKHNSEM